MLLEEEELWNVAEKVITIPTDAKLLVEYTKKNVKAKRIILDAIKGHAIPHVTGKKNAYERWESLTKLHQDDQN